MQIDHDALTINETDTNNDTNIIQEEHTNECEPSEYAFKTVSAPIESVLLTANLTGMASTTLCSLIELCDSQYVQLDSVLTKQWFNELTRLYKILYSSESKGDQCSLILTQ